MKDEYDVFSVDISKFDSEQMDKFQEFMNILNDSMDGHVLRVSKELGVSIACASDVVYLRGRSRWTQELEDELVQMDKVGDPRPNIFEWPLKK